MSRIPIEEEMEDCLSLSSEESRAQGNIGPTIADTSSQPLRQSRSFVESNIVGATRDRQRCLRQVNDHHFDLVQRLRFIVERPARRWLP